MSRIAALGIAWAVGVVPLPAYAQAGFSFASAGVHAGAIVDREGIAETLVGAQVRFDVTRLMSVVSAVSWRPGFPDDPTGRLTGTAWQGYATARIQPFGARTAIALGYGVAITYATARDPVRDLRVSQTDLADVGVLSLGLMLGRLHPFVELYVLDLIASPGTAGTHLVAGVSLMRR